MIILEKSEQKRSSGDPGRTKHNKKEICSDPRRAANKKKKKVVIHYY